MHLNKLNVWYTVSDNPLQQSVGLMIDLSCYTRARTRKSTKHCGPRNGVAPFLSRPSRWTMSNCIDILYSEYMFISFIPIMCGLGYDVVSWTSRIGDIWDTKDRPTHSSLEYDHWNTCKIQSWPLLQVLEKTNRMCQVTTPNVARSMHNKPYWSLYGTKTCNTLLLLSPYNTLQWATSEEVNYKHVHFTVFSFLWTNICETHEWIVTGIPLKVTTSALWRYRFYLWRVISALMANESMSVWRDWTRPSAVFENQTLQPDLFRVPNGSGI